MAPRPDDIAERLTSSIGSLEELLRPFGAGQPCWVTINSGEDSYGYWQQDVGYAPVDTSWRLAIRETEGHEGAPEFQEDVRVFDEAPLYLRAKAIDKLPQLIAAIDEVNTAIPGDNVLLRSRVLELNAAVASLLKHGERISERSNRSK